MCGASVEVQSERVPVSAVGPKAKSPSVLTHLLRVLTWWTGATINTRFYTWRFGEAVGTDEFGNTYYRKIGGAIDAHLGFDRRWVIYAGESEGSATPPGWYGWLRHQTDEIPTATNYKPREWEKPYEPNMTGTPGAYRPQGSVLRTGHRPSTGGDYDAWTPN